MDQPEMGSNTVKCRALTLLVAWMLLLLLAVACNPLTSKSAVSLSPLSLESPLVKVGVSSQTICSPANASKGAITGRLYIGGAHSTVNQPAIGSLLYLGEYIGLETGRPFVILDVARHQHTETGEDGWFCFPEVAPGTYGLIVWDAVESVLLNDPTTGLSLVIEVRPGETLDLGTLYSPIP